MSPEPHIVCSISPQSRLQKESTSFSMAVILLRVGEDFEGIAMPILRHDVRQVWVKNGKVCCAALKAKRSLRYCPTRILLVICTSTTFNTVGLPIWPVQRLHLLCCCLYLLNRFLHIRVTHNFSVFINMRVTIALF